METNDNQVEKIITFLKGKIEQLRKAKAAYENPIMQDMAKNSPHLQMDYIRISSALQENEENLLAIQTFTGDASQKVKPSKESSNGDNSGKNKQKDRQG